MTSQSHSQGLHSWTEKPGEFFPVETQSIIRDRYEFAASVCQNLKTLEIGAGSGMGVKYLSEHVSRLTCLEYSAENYAMLSAQQNANVEIHHGDAHSMPFSDGEHEAIIALAMIYYLQLEPFLSEARRVLAPRGKLFFCSSNKDVPGFVPALHTTRYYSVPELAQHLSNAGFRAEFYGAFPVSEQPLQVRKLKAVIKDSVKSLIRILPMGDRIWSRMRQSTLKDVQPLPDDVAQMQAYDGERQSLSPSSPDTSHRVIYVVAELNDS